MGFPEEIVVPLSASHNSIAKFKSPNDTNYATFYRHLALALREIREARGVREVPSTAPPAYTPRATYIPHSGLSYVPDVPQWTQPPIQTHSTGPQRPRYVPSEWRR